MIVTLEDLKVYFPYDFMYPEQLSYMLELKHSLDAKGHAAIEMPCGTGKTMALLALIISYRLARPNSVSKLVYCTRTTTEVDKVMSELSTLLMYLEKCGVSTGNDQILGLALTSRKNLCVNPVVASLKDGRVIDSKCRQLVDAAPLADLEDLAKGDGPQTSCSCSFYTKIPQDPGSTLSWPAVSGDLGQAYSLPRLRKEGSELGLCPYWSVRKSLSRADVVVLSYAYVLDPRVSASVSTELATPGAVLVFDEAHNIDSVCIDALSVRLTRDSVERASTAILRLKDILKKTADKNANALKQEYESLLAGLSAQRERLAVGDSGLDSPVLPADLLTEAVPGNIRSGQHFLAFMTRFVEYISMRLRANRTCIESPALFLQDLARKCCLARKPLRFAHSRLSSLMTTLRKSGSDTTLDSTMSALVDMASLASLASTYLAGFVLLIEASDTQNSGVGAIMHLACLDASLAIKPVFKAFQSVVITSGTLSPIEMYPALLGFRPAVTASLCMTTNDAGTNTGGFIAQSVCPLIVTRGADQAALTSKFAARDDSGVLRNYGLLLLEMASCIPDGLVAFFPSYAYLDSVIAAWHEQGVLDELQKRKLIFVETRDAVESSLAVASFRKAVDAGRGAALLCVSRGKVSEGVDFENEYGRCVIVFGIPYVYTQCRRLRARMDFLRATLNIRESDFLTFDAIRHASQCVGRCVRNKKDYGVAILADQRYARHDKKSRLPVWLQQQLSPSTIDLSTDEAVHVAKRFLRAMAQHGINEKESGSSAALLDSQGVVKFLEKRNMDNAILQVVTQQHEAAAASQRD